MIRVLLSTAMLLAAGTAAFAQSSSPLPPSSPPAAIATPDVPATRLVPVAPAGKPMSSAPVKVRLVEPHLHVVRAGKGAARVALTFDACMGQTDHRILDTLVTAQVPATIFVTARWLKSNPEALAVLVTHPDLFEIEDHGLNHIPAVDEPTLVYGIKAAGSPAAVAQEVKGGADAMVMHGLTPPQWFRGATAKYTPSAIAQIRGMGYRVAGYSLNGDSGASLPAKAVEKNYLAARDGDVLISHINQPTHASGEGVAKGILDLKARGTQFVRLSDFTDHGDDATTQ